MENTVVSRRELFSFFIKKIGTPGKTMSMYGIEDILPLKFKWQKHTMWAENNGVLSVSDDEDALLFSEKMSVIQLYISRNLDGTRSIAELCDEAVQKFRADRKIVYSDTFDYICVALKNRIIETAE
jgi:hypothetical protein